MSCDSIEDLFLEELPPNSDGLVDHLIGNAYYVVRSVAMKLAEITRLYESIDNIDTVATNITNVNAVVTNIPMLTSIYGKLDELDLIATQLDTVLGKFDDLSSATGSSMVGFKQAGAGAVTRTLENKAREVVSVKDYGVVGDGVTDDTNSIMAAHIYANTIGASVSYEGISSFTIQANAQVPIKTSTDFNNADIILLGGINLVPSFSTFNTAFVVSDDECPLVTVTGPIASANLKVGSLFPTLGLFDGHGYAKITCGLQVPNRAKTGTQNYTQSFKVNRNGKSSLPLSADISAFASAITINYRKTSKARLTIKGVSLTEGSWNNQRLFYVQRCNVNFDGFTHLFDTSVGDNICEIISLDNVSDISIDNYVTTGRPSSSSLFASYSLAINGGADIRVNNMNALEGWGCFGCNDINGLYVSNSTVNRIDCHSSGHNIFADNCDIHQYGMVYGWGGGLLSAKNSRFYRCVPISARQDWGGTFFGQIVVDSCEVSNNFTASLTLVDLATNPLGASTPVYAPSLIKVSNVTRIGAASSNNGEIIPVALKVSDATSVVYSPAVIEVVNVSCSFSQWRFGMRVDTLNLEAYPVTLNTRIVIDGVYPDAVPNSSSGVLTAGVLEYDSIRTPTNPVRPQIKVTDSENIAIRCRNSNFVDIRINNASICAIVVDTATATKPVVSVDSSRFVSMPSGMTATVIGAGNSGTDRQTIIRNSEFAALGFDLSNVAALSGNTIRTGGTQPTLPAGCTAALAFTGWQKSGVFS